MTEIISKELTDKETADRKAYAASEYDRAYAEVQLSRQGAYQTESDPLFFAYQRSEDGATKQAWLDKVSEIKARYPYPEK